jgi:hypothetical protein
MNNIELERGFIEVIDKSEFSLYSDTDSTYNKVPLPFSKWEDSHKTVAYTQELAKELNDKFTVLFNETVVKYGNVNPKYNRMKFKSEVVAARGFFNKKKYYGLAKLWDEGTFFDPPKVKKTGGQIVKADSTKIIFDLLVEIYNTLLMDFSVTDEITLYRKIFFELREKYLKRTLSSVTKMDFEDFGIPKKWGLRELKTIPKQVQGAMLYNFLFNDNLRPGDSVLQCQVIINTGKLLQYCEQHPTTSKYQLPKDLITSKLNVISFPNDLTEDECLQIEEKFKLLNIRFDLGTIQNFNVDMKIDQFKELFSEQTKRMAI